eukprot:m.199772 g.199772  ORF g.199772 m.199772 type:complete len:412 (-) comp20824_c0_seq2:1189-2424(-)
MLGLRRAPDNQDAKPQAPQRTPSNPGEETVFVYEPFNCARGACGSALRRLAFRCKGQVGGGGCPAVATYCSVECRLKDWATHEQAHPACAAKNATSDSIHQGPLVFPRGARKGPGPLHQSRRPKPPVPVKPKVLTLAVHRDRQPPVAPKPAREGRNNPRGQQRGLRPRVGQQQQPNLPKPPFQLIKETFRGIWVSETAGEDPLFRVVEIKCDAKDVVVVWVASNVPFEQEVHVDNEDYGYRRGVPSVELDAHPSDGHQGMRWAFQPGGDPDLLHSRAWAQDDGEAAVDKAAIDTWRRIDAEQANRLARAIDAINTAQRRAEAVPRIRPPGPRAVGPHGSVAPISGVGPHTARIKELERANAELKRELTSQKLSSATLSGRGRNNDANGVSKSSLWRSTSAVPKSSKQKRTR